MSTNDNWRHFSDADLAAIVRELMRCYGDVPFRQRYSDCEPAFRQRYRDLPVPGLLAPVLRRLQRGRNGNGSVNRLCAEQAQHPGAGDLGARPLADRRSRRRRCRN